MQADTTGGAIPGAAWLVFPRRAYGLMNPHLQQFLRRWTGHTPVIGLDIGREGVRMLQVEGEPGQMPRVLWAARRELRLHRQRGGAPSDPGAHLSAAMEAVSDLLRRGGFEGRRVVAALPRQYPLFRTLRVNVSDGVELPRTLAREARNSLGVDVTTGRYVVHFLPGDVLRRGSDTHQEGLLIVVRKRDVEHFVAQLHACGADVAAIDLEPLTLYRGVHRFARRRRDAQDVQVLVDLGSHSTQVVIGRAGRIGFHKSISIGTGSLHAAVGRKLGLPPQETAELCRRLEQQVRQAVRSGDVASLESDPLHRAAFSASRAILEDLSRELGLCLRYYSITFRCKRPERVLLCGAAAEDPRLQRVLASALPIPVEPRRALLDLDVPPNLLPVMQDSAEEWSTALGLALRFSPAGLAGRSGISRDLQALADDQQEEDLDSATLARRPYGAIDGERRHWDLPPGAGSPAPGLLEEAVNG